MLVGGDRSRTRKRTRKIRVRKDALGRAMEAPTDTTAAVASWKSQIKRLQQCYANSPKSRQCLPTVDTDGSLANYRGFKAAHPSLGLGGSTAFIARDAFLDACDAQLVYANRRQTGGYGVLAMMCVALLVWIIRCALTLRKPNYSKRPRETEMKPLTTFSEKKSFNNRYHPDSVWLWYSFVTAMFGFAVQLYSFYTPTTTDIRIPIAQGVWITFGDRHPRCFDALGQVHLGRGECYLL